ncbi:MAG: hypothetical protein ABIO51_06865 [Solirubrobacteraceae bacterium]
MLANRTLLRGIVVAALTGTATAGALAAGSGAQTTTTQPVFSNPGAIDNPYLPLTKYKRCVLRGGGERSVKTLLPTTKAFSVDGRRVEAVIIRDNAYEGAKLVESTLDYYVQADEGTVHYFGEQVKNLRNGKVVNTHGTWLYGKDTDRLGVAMPADPQLGQQYRFEDVPGVTTESNRVEELGLRAEVQGRVVEDVIRIQEFIQPEGAVEYKTYAPGLGVIDEYPPDGHVSFADCR